MTPKKAIIIVLILFLILILAVAGLYLIEQPADSGNEPLSAGAGRDGSAGAVNQERLTPLQEKIKIIETKTNNLVGQIVEQGQTANGGITLDAQRKIEAAVNQELVEKNKLKTPEQLRADERRRLELEKIEQQVNEQIKERLQNQ